MSVTSDVILVSTIHKSKGREYDNVFLIIDREPRSNEDKRAIYVGMTRAKSSLWIGYNGNYFRELVSELGSYTMDSRQFSDPPKISLTLGLTHVYLDVFANYQDEIGKLLPGDELRFSSHGLVSRDGKKVLRFSRAFRERLEMYANRSFVIETARVNYVVYWWDENQRKEMKVILPEVILGKS